MPFPNPDTQFKSGNTAAVGNGRPRGRSTGTILRELAEATVIGSVPIPRGKTLDDVIAEAIVNYALKGDARFMQILLDRKDGKVVDKHEVIGRDGGPIAADADADVRVRIRSSEEIDAWREKKRGEISARRSSMLNAPSTAPTSSTNIS